MSTIVGTLAKGSKTTPENERKNNINELFSEMNMFQQQISEASKNRNESSGSDDDSSSSCEDSEESSYSNADDMFEVKPAE